MQRAKRVVLRDLAIFQLKLVIDGLKDLTLAPLSIAAAATDVVFPGKRVGHRFYFVVSAAEKFDRWLNVFGAAEHADAERNGLFGMSRAGSNSLLGRLEAIVLGHDEPEPTENRFRDAA